ncbi:MAG: hypothetical protein TR69_WS6001001124 [candidate division WS6 bacterium OLB20]|uniref:Lipoprotein n=1 Tax=candidate division WS6 bacterium OLB20 TaxID=1617426 RepID=A0A136LZL5_9BACT|nr:MAG: hypothetical protein TR69_WS6001001124 [candidate division WS6 bacterium OLB20]
MFKRAIVSALGVFALAACTSIPGLGGFSQLGSQQEIDSFLSRVADAYENVDQFRMQGDYGSGTLDYIFNDGNFSYVITAEDGDAQIYKDDMFTYMGIEQDGELQWFKYDTSEDSGAADSADLRSEMLQSLRGDDDTTQYEYVGLTSCASPSGQCQEFTMTEDGSEGTVLFGAGDNLPYSFTVTIEDADGEIEVVTVAVSYTNVPAVEIPQEAKEAQSFQELLEGLGQ